MNRRSYLKYLVGNQPNAGADIAMQPAVMSAEMSPPSNITEFTEEWTYEKAAHLLRRATFGPTHEQIMQALDLGLKGTIDLLFSKKTLPDPPVNFSFGDDPYVPVGESWIDKPNPQNSSGINGYRNTSIRAWTYMQFLEDGTSIREKMVVFWHNHFAVAFISDPNYLFHYINLIRKYATGNFRELIKEMTINGAMLNFLNGNQSTKRAPNENFARELLELYTVGKGALAGPGDYSTFTEEDVIAISKVLTGWKDEKNTNGDKETIDVIFHPDLHDTSDKQLSHRFGNATISNGGAEEYKNLIDTIFQQESAAKFICRKLYRWFVYYDIDDAVENDIIGPLAQILIENDYEIEPVLRTLFSSQHFSDIQNVGPYIKNPIDYTTSVLKQTYAYESIPKDAQSLYYSIMYELRYSIILMQMWFYNPPSVAGWEAYYETPNYYRLWINATTLRERFNYANSFASSRGARIENTVIKSNPLKMIQNIELEASKDPNIVVREFSKMLHPKPLTDKQYDGLKNILIPGLPDFEWTVEFSAYLNNPEDVTIKKSVETKLHNLLKVLLTMEEFQLS